MKNSKNIFIIALVVMALAAIAAIAGTVYDRVTQALTVTGGTATWTNTVNYASLSLKRIWVQKDLDVASTVTVTRVSSDNTYTDAVGTIVAAAGTGSSASFTAAYLKTGDMLKFANSTATGATMIVEYEVQKH